jgi:hypothetical protein
VRTLLPWLPAFLFGGVLILVGKYLQWVEKKKRLERKLTSQFWGAGSSYSIYTIQASSSPLGAYQGKAQKKQEESIYKH